MIAKIASDYNKPDGLCIVPPDRAMTFLDPLKVESLWLVGHKTAHEMHQLGIFTVKQLREQSISTLRRAFGKHGDIFYNYARGTDDSPVEVRQERKSVSCETTFDTDLTLHSALIISLYHIVVELAERIKKSRFVGRTLTLKVKYADFTQITRSMTHSAPITKKDCILPLAKKLLKKVEFGPTKPIRLMGLGVSTGNDEQPKRKEWRELELPFEE